MRSTRLLRIVLANLRRSRNHFLLASIGIVVGIATFAFFTAMGLGVRAIVLGKIYPLDQIEVAPKQLQLDIGPLRLGVGADALNDARVQELAAIPGVADVYPKMRLTVPAVVLGGEAILGNDLRSEMIADGLEPALVLDEVRGRYAFRDFDDPRGASPPTTCTSDAACGADRYCGLPAGTRVPAEPRKRKPSSEQTRVCRDYVPVLASNHVIELYNGALRRAHDFPALNPSAVIGLTFDLVIGASMVGASARDEVLLERGRLVGFSDKAITLGITLPIGYVKRYNVMFGDATAATRYHSAIVRVPVKDDVARVAKAVDDLGLDVVDSGAEQAALLIAIFMAVFGLVSAVIVTIAAVNIMHVFFMLVYERKHEIGIMRAVGASRLDVIRIILGEAAILGALAGMAGLLLAWGTAVLCNFVSARYIPDFPYKPETYFAFPLWLMALAVGFSIAFCVLGAVVPARRASRLEPAIVLTGR